MSSLAKHMMTNVLLPASSTKFQLHLQSRCSLAIHCVQARERERDVTLACVAYP